MSILLPLEAIGYRFGLTPTGKVVYECESSDQLDTVTAPRLLMNLKENKAAAITELQTRQELLARHDLSFVNLHVHTDRSVFDGYQTVEEIICRVKELNQTAFAVTDHGTVSALHHAATIARKKGLMFIPGVETYYCPDLAGAQNGINAHLLLLALTEEGRINLNRLVSLSYVQRYRKPLISLQDLAQHHEGLVATTACRGGILSLPDHRRHVLSLQQIFEENLLIEIQTGAANDQVLFNKYAVELAQQLKIPLVASSDAHYAKVTDAATHQKWLRLSAERGGSYADDYSLADLQTAIMRLSYLPQEKVAEAIANTSRIADRCEVSMPASGRFYPQVEFASVTGRVGELCEQGWHTRKLDQLAPEKQAAYRARLESEIKVLEAAGYLEYLLIVADVVEFCRSKNIRTGPGRGSAVGSLVVFLLGITGIDPVREELLFERFCHLHRVSPPDVDLDVQASRREEVLSYLEAKYPHARQVRTVTVLQDKAAIQRAGKALSISPQHVNRLTKTISLLAEAPLQSPVPEISRQAYLEVISLSKLFRGRVQSFGVHASALLLFPGNAEQWCSIEGQRDEFVTAFDHQELEELGLLKIDVLGVSALDTVDAMLREITPTLDLTTIPEADEKTLNLLRSGATFGIFQMGSAGMDRLVSAANPRCRQDLVPLLALYRPGPLQSGMAKEYLRVGAAASGPGYLHPDLVSILESTRGQIIFQEQIMRIAAVMGGFDLGEADLFRRAVAKKKPGEMERVLAEFTQRCLQRGYKKEIVDVLVTSLGNFADYAFNKSHSAAYSVLTYQMAYLKAHYPARFLCSALNVDLGDHEKAARYVAEARVLGINVQGPDMKNPLQTWWLKDQKTLIAGLGAIKGIGNISVPPNPGLSGPEYLKLLQSETAKIRKNVIKSLVMAGCFETDTDAVAKTLGVKVPADAAFAVFGFSTQDQLEGKESLAQYEPFEVILARPATTRTGDQMAFALLRGGAAVTEVVGFRSIASQLVPGRVLHMFIKDGKIIGVKPLPV